MTLSCPAIQKRPGWCLKIVRSSADAAAAISRQTVAIRRIRRQLSRSGCRSSGRTEGIPPNIGQSRRRCCASPHPMLCTRPARGMAGKSVFTSLLPAARRNSRHHVLIANHAEDAVVRVNDGQHPVVITSEKIEEVIAYVVGV